MRMLSTYQLAKKLNVHVNTIRRWAAADVLPPPYQLTNKTARWNESEIDNWLAARRPATETQGGVEYGVAIPDPHAKAAKG